LLYGNKLDYFADFFKENGSRKIIFFYHASKVRPLPELNLSLIMNVGGAKLFC